jgi:pyruvate dehydrogenase E2 component (dihydrolipoamide acetyltransferase)
MSVLVLMPALSPTMEEGALARWLVKEGDRVRPGDVIAEIETDKAVMEVEAADEGIVRRLLVQQGAQGVKVNTPIAELEVDGQEGVAPDATPRPTAPPSQPSPLPLERPATGPGMSRAVPAHEALRVRASPLARRIARTHGVALAAIRGTGPHGRIIRADVEGHLARSRPAPPPSAPVARLDPRVYAADSYELLPLDGVRRVTARRLTDSFMHIPHFPLSADIEIDRLIAARKAINSNLEPGQAISLNDMMIKASAIALMAHPEAHASYTDDGIARHRAAHISVAVAIEGGLMTPVVRDAHSKGLAQIAGEVRELARRARERRLKPHEYQGGTFSISNLGMFGVRSFGSILNPPESMILSIGEGSRRPVVRNDAIVAATVMTVTLTCDHRVVDGATGARWLQTFRQLIETPETMLL